MPYNIENYKHFVFFAQFDFYYFTSLEVLILDLLNSGSHLKCVSTFIISSCQIYQANN